MSLHVVAYPQLTERDRLWIESVREQHNSLHNIIAAHFTLVFSVADISADEFVSEVRDLIKEERQLPFVLRVATINRDAISGQYDAFLVPEEGHAAIIRLHDHLYSRRLSPHHRLDIPYIPHISVGNNADPLVTQSLVQRINHEGVAIAGRIDALSVIDYRNRKVSLLEEIGLT